jgi:hypothetical protein
MHLVLIMRRWRMTHSLCSSYLIEGLKGKKEEEGEGTGYGAECQPLGQDHISCTSSGIRLASLRVTGWPLLGRITLIPSGNVNVKGSSESVTFWV